MAWYSAVARTGRRGSVLPLFRGRAERTAWLIKSRNGDATPTVSAKTPSDAVKKPDDTGKSTNALEVRVGVDKVDFVINGAIVHSEPKTGALAKSDGIYGIRASITSWKSRSTALACRSRARANPDFFVFKTSHRPLDFAVRCVRVIKALGAGRPVPAVALISDRRSHRSNIHVRLTHRLRPDQIYNFHFERLQREIDSPMPYRAHITPVPWRNRLSRTVTHTEANLSVCSQRKDRLQT